MHERHLYHALGAGPTSERRSAFEEDHGMVKSTSRQGGRQHLMGLRPSGPPPLSHLLVTCERVLLTPMATTYGPLEAWVRAIMCRPRPFVVHCDMDPPMERLEWEIQDSTTHSVDSRTPSQGFPPTCYGFEPHALAAHPGNKECCGQCPQARILAEVSFMAVTTERPY